MRRHIIQTTALLSLALAGSAASAAVITASDSWNGRGSVALDGVTISACNTAAAGACAQPGLLGTKLIPNVGVGVGVQGQGNNEIDWYDNGTRAGNSEMLRFQFGTASVIDSLQLGLLFDGPEYTDVQESAGLRVVYDDGATASYTLRTLFSPAGGTFAWDGSGSWSGFGLGDGQAGLWTALDPFGGRGVLQLDLFAISGVCGTSSACADQSDYVFRSLTTSAVPEPAALALLGAGLLGMGMARRRRRSARA